MTDDERTKVDYERTSQYFFHLADVRFKLLALLPIASGTALVLVPSHLGPPETLAVGVLGLLATAGLLLYDQRNSQIYNSLLGRLNLIEESLRLPPLREDKQVGGAFIDRPGGRQRRKLLGLIPAHHGLGLDLIYSASTAAWIFVIAGATLELVSADPTTALTWSLALPAVAGVVVFGNFRRVDKRSGWEGELPAEVKQRIDRPAAGAGGGEPRGQA
jgi:hypothetical protein